MPFQVKNLVEALRSHLQKSPDTVERALLRRSAHSLAELSKTGLLLWQLDHAKSDVSWEAEKLC